MFLAVFRGILVRIMKWLCKEPLWLGIQVIVDNWIYYSVWKEVNEALIVDDFLNVVIRVILILPYCNLASWKVSFKLKWCLKNVDCSAAQLFSEF